MKIYFKFDDELEEDREKLKLMQKAVDMSIALEDIHNQVWRPSWKHGYPDPAIQSLLDELGDKGYILIERLHQVYLQILNEREVNSL